MKKFNSVLKDKRASEDVIYPIVIFIILNLIFFSIMMVFVYRSSTGALIYEQLYAKQIALLIDQANPESTIIIDFEKGIEISKKNEFPVEKIISERNGEVVIKLSEKGGRSFKHFSNSNVDFHFDEQNLVINIKENPN